MKILSLDPGSQVTGFAFLAEPSSTHIKVLESGIIDLRKIETFWDRIAFLSQELEKKMQHYQPEQVALESLIFVKNPHSLMKLAQIRGAMIATITRFQLPIFEYSPNLIKQAVTGHGHADKEQMQKWVSLQTGQHDFESHDESDAIAIGLCHWLATQGKVSSVMKGTKKRAKSLGESLMHAVREQR